LRNAATFWSNVNCLLVETVYNSFTALIDIPSIVNRQGNVAATPV
jgi:hypothetical protein